MRKKIISVCLISLVFVLSLCPSVFGANPLSANLSFDGKSITIKGVLVNGNNDEFGILIVDPENKKSVYQDTGMIDGSFEFTFDILEDGPIGEYTVTIDARKADNPVVLKFNKTTGAVAAFSDISEAAWASDAIKHMKEKGYIQGDGNGKFRPNDAVSCAELIKLALSVVAGETNTEDANDWSKAWIESAALKGLTDKIFAGCDLNAPATRQQAAAIVYELMQAKPEQKDIQAVFEDYESISEYAKDAISALYGTLFYGVTETTFAPNDTLSRAQIATILYRLEV